MNELVGFLTILLFCLLKLNKHLKNKNIPRTAEELELDKKRKKSEQYWVMDIHGDSSFSNVPGNEYHKY